MRLWVRKTDSCKTHIVSSCSLDIRDHGLLTDGAPEEAIAPPMSSPLLSRYDWEWGHQIQGCVQVGICGVATPATPESLPTPVPLLGPSTGIAPLATEGWIDPDHPDTGSGTGPLQPTDDATIGPTLLFPRTHPATPDIPEILDIELLDPIEVQLLHAPVDERVPMGLVNPRLHISCHISRIMRSRSSLGAEQKAAKSGPLMGPPVRRHLSP